MKNKNLILILIISLLFNVTGCKKEEILQKSNSQKEQFMYGATLKNNQHIFFSTSVPYLINKESNLFDTISNEKITIDEFLSKLSLIEELRDGGSKLYKYNKEKTEFGDKDFYVISCNSTDNIKDVYVAKSKESLEGKCNLKIDDLEGVSISIKKGTLTKSGATIIITDTSNRDNVYGECYFIEKKDNNSWIKLIPQNTMLFNYIGYRVDNDNRLELKIDWEYHYGKLEDGRYRIVKSTSEIGEATNHFITVEFTIN